MRAKERFLTALERKTPDRLPVTTHHVMPFFLEHTMGGISDQEFFDDFGLDPILWVVAHRADSSRGEFFDIDPKQQDILESPFICSESWIIEREILCDKKSKAVRFHCRTPRKTLSMVLESDDKTTWVTERLIKEKSDIDLFARYAPVPLCDVDSVNRKAESFGDRGLIRGTVPGFGIYGQPGCWQDAAVLFGIEDLILATYDDPQWAHTFLSILREKKLPFMKSTEGARFDLVELGGGDASSTVVSPSVFEQYVAPYDAELIDAAHAAGQRIVYHTCGGMMPILETIADMKPDAMETFTPPSLGGDVDLAEAKQRIGYRVCMIGGFDQFHYFMGTTPEKTRAAVRRCFEDAGDGGGFILAPSDHFFEADTDLLKAFADEAKQCTY